MKKAFVLLLATMITLVGHAEITLGDNQVWWGYFNDNGLIDYHVGSNQAGAIDAAIFIPANHAIAGAATIKAVRLWLGDDISKVGDMTLWISKSLPTTASAADYTQTVTKSSLKVNINEIELTTPYVVNNDGIYVGVSFPISGKTYPIMSAGNDAVGSFFLRFTGGVWRDLYGEGYGKFAFQVLLDGVTLGNSDATPLDFGTSHVEKNGTITVPVEIYNNGKETISNISYTITTDGKESAEQTIYVDDITFASTGIAYISFSADEKARKYSKTLTLTKVNGVANEAKKKTSTGNLITLSERPAVTPVVEEFTGTWCGYCPYGFVGMEKVYETFGDKVALIAVHKGDIMETKDYYAIVSPSGYPSSRIDREHSLYPSASSLKSYINNILENKVAVASIKAAATWTGTGKTAIKIDTKTQFVYSEDNGQYGIAYVLAEDGLSGSGDEWNQTNYLSGGSGNRDMQFWYDSDSYVSGLEFNHVAVAAWNITDGAKGSVSPKIVNGAVQTYSFEADITGKKLIQNKSKLKVITLLIDRTTGFVVNAAQTSIMDYDESAVQNFTLTYMVDGESYKTYDVKYGASITPEADPEREGYTFSGWSEIPETMPDKDVIVTGTFITNKYKLTYVVDGDNYKIYEVEYGTDITAEAEPTKEGYSFSGWSLIPTTMPAKDIIITGSFTKGQYKLVYMVDGQTYKTVSFDYGAAITPENAPEREGYTFSGWSEIPATMPAKDVTVTGTFSINTYTLAYMVDGETYKTYEVEYGASITPEADPEKDGYSFSGWSDIPNVMPAKDVTVTGMFAINKYILAYQVDGETYKTYEVEYGKDITAEEEPTKEGYTFSGWSWIPDTMPAEDVVITGSFTFIDAIVDVIADDEIYQIYTLDGKPIETLQKGVNIIRYTDGKVTKVLVK